MDEGTLSDLLECSVCLERLDTSSKVLPCQHTFCKKCLDEIVHKHKELRCPECRILVKVRVDDLPPNVLLMRILEGMKNAGNVVQKRSNKDSRSLINTVSTPILSPNVFQQLPLSDNKSVPKQQSNLSVVPHHPYAKAVYDYSSKETGDLSFKRGDIIILKKRIDSHWYQGECGGQQGVFPLSYVQIVTPVPSHLPQCKALYDFRMTNDEEEGCLVFNKGDIINVIRRVDENWAEGKLDGKIGIFPLAFVELNNLARSLMKLSTNAQPGPSRVAPPTPTLDESTPLIPTDHTKTVQHQVSLSQNAHINSTPDSGGSTPSTISSSSSTPNVSSSNTSSGASTAPSSPASPPHVKVQPLPSRSIAQKPDVSPNTKQFTSPKRSPQIQNAQLQSDAQIFNPHDKEKRHSFTGLPKPHHSTTTHNRHSAEILTSEGQVICNSHSQASERSVRSAPAVPVHDIQLPATYVALYPYKPHKADELELKKGSIYIVTERCQDGWFKGTSNRTLKSGVFPGNYVTLARGIPNQGGNEANESKFPVNLARSVKNSTTTKHSASNPPELPPRSTSPATTISTSWHGHQDNAALPLGRSTSTIMSGVSLQHVTTTTTCISKTMEKVKERKEKSTVSLMKRLASMKRSKSPPPCTYSIDNPVFEDSSVKPAKSPAHPVHVRSGSCPSQLLQIQHSDHHRMFGSSSQRHKHKERPTIFTHSSRSGENSSSNVCSSPDLQRHRKSNSLDAGNKSKTTVQTVRERYRCIAPYPPNSEYELELQVNDIIYVHKKRDDGWYKGTQQRTGKTGLFPASFVENY